MRLGLIVYGGLDATSGGTLYDRQVVDGLRRIGVTVEVIALPDPHGPLTYARRLAHSLDSRLTARLGAQIAAARVEALLQDELCHPSLLALNARLRRRTDIPLIGVVHHLRASEAHPRWQNALYGRIERRYLRTLQGVVANSATTLAAVTTLLGRPLPAVVAPPAADHLGATLGPEAITARCRGGGPLHVLFAGNLIPRKGLHTLIDALAQIDADWRLTVIGDPAIDSWYVKQIRSQIARAGLGERIRLAGRVPTDALIAAYASHDVLAVPSSYEGFGIVYLEGMAFGLPALAAADGGAREVVTHGATGYLVPPGDAAALAGHLRELAADRERLLALSLAARARFDAHPTWAQTTARIRAFVAEVIG